MEELYSAISNLFNELSYSIGNLSDSEYRRPSNQLSQASIGQHVRHIIELFLELNKGYASGVVNYEKRKRDMEIETNKTFALQLFSEILEKMDLPNKNLLLEANYEWGQPKSIQLETNYFREIAYNLEHTVHHMALIRIGIAEISTMQLSKEFGVAASTIQYRKACAQ